MILYILYQLLSLHFALSASVGSVTWVTVAGLTFTFLFVFIFSVNLDDSARLQVFDNKSVRFLVRNAFENKPRKAVNVTQ
jgi:hypothetical protein